MLPNAKPSIYGLQQVFWQGLSGERRRAKMGRFLGDRLGKDFAWRAQDNCKAFCGLQGLLGVLGTDLVRQSKIKNGIL
jgi:hypothetical protein